MCGGAGAGGGRRGIRVEGESGKKKAATVEKTKKERQEMEEKG